MMPMWKYGLFLVVVLLLPRIPVVGKFFNIINTALHEFGHALVGLLAGGEVRKIELFQDASGTTTTTSNNRFIALLVSLAGYPFAVSVGWLSFYLIQNQAAQGLLIGLSVLFLLMLLFWVRNGYGILWIILFCGVNGALIYYDNVAWINDVATFYAMMILAESIWSGLVLIILSLRDGNKAGDATNLAKITHIPAIIWSILFEAYTALVVYRVVKMLFF